MSGEYTENQKIETKSFVKKKSKSILGENKVCMNYINFEYCTILKTFYLVFTFIMLPIYKNVWYLIK